MVSKRALRGTEPLGYVPPPGPSFCPLCGRMLEPGPSVDDHHLVPRSQGGKTKTTIHRICHRKIHATLSERELASARSRGQPAILCALRELTSPMQSRTNTRSRVRRPAWR